MNSINWNIYDMIIVMCQNLNPIFISILDGFNSLWWQWHNIEYTISNYLQYKPSKPTAMKTLNFYFAIILINLFTLRVTAQSKKYKFKAIQISTNVLVDNLPANNYSVILFKDGLKLD